MQYSTDWDMQWTNGIATNHTVDVDLNLQLDKILPFKDLTLRLHTEEQKVRKEIAALVLEQIMPAIIQKTGMSYETPGYLEVHTKSHNDAHGFVLMPTIPQNMLGLKSRMRITMNMCTNRPVNAMQALHGNRGGFTTEVTNQVMKFLKKAVLGIVEEGSDTHASMKDNTLDEFEHRVRRSSSSN